MYNIISTNTRFKWKVVEKMDTQQWLDSFVNKPFTELTLIFVLLLVLMIINFVYITFLKEKISLVKYLAFNSSFIMLICVVLLFKTGVIIDKFAMSGEGIDTDLVIGAIIVFCMQIIFFKKITNKTNNS